MKHEEVMGAVEAYRTIGAFCAITKDIRAFLACRPLENSINCYVAFKEVAGIASQTAVFVAFQASVLSHTVIAASVVQEEVA